MAEGSSSSSASLQASSTSCHPQIRSFAVLEQRNIPNFHLGTIETPAAAAAIKRVLEQYKIVESGKRVTPADISPSKFTFAVCSKVNKERTKGA